MTLPGAIGPGLFPTCQKAKTMKKYHHILLCGIALLFGGSVLAGPTLLEERFSDPAQRLPRFGRGEYSISDGVLRTRETCVVLGDSTWRNYVFSFRARAPKGAEQVQIWAGFRTWNRFDRYVVGIKGGLQDDLYLMRSGYMGTDEFLALRPLYFHPVPGQWYDIRVEVCGSRIRVFLNGESLPRIDVVDRNAACLPSGGISLGGGWIETEYDDLQVTALAGDALDGCPSTEYREGLTAAEKESKRLRERAEYRPLRLDALTGSRTEFSLDGRWLFKPEYELPDPAAGSRTETDDASWHVMTVPDFWTPIRIWLHGETMPSASGPQPKGVSDTYYQQESDRCENYTFDYRRTGAAWYRQWVDLPAAVAGKRAVLSFDAVSKMAEVYVNGHLAGIHVGMFAGFEIDATQWLHPGRNLIAVKVVRDIRGAAVQTGEAMENYYASVRRGMDENRSDTQAHKPQLTDIPHGFYGDNPAGIWQPVRLIVSDPLHLEDIFIRPALDGATFDITVANASTRRRTCDLQVAIVDRQTGDTLHLGTLFTGERLTAGERRTRSCTVDGLRPKLWDPATPNLYDFVFRLTERHSHEADRRTITSGFRTFEARDGYLWLNGRKYWLRGGNHIPFALRPNDVSLADRFMQLMKAGNVNSTRTHTTPWNELWISAADRNGIGISFEGTWPWLMIHSTPIPDRESLELWRREWLQLMRRYRNHPSILFWTVNNEMKFYDLDADSVRAAEKFRIISDVVGEMREEDPTRPVCFDSNYTRRNGVRRFGEDFFAMVDDGDIDDNHAYYNWYDYSIFRFFRGEFQRQFKTPGRPLISQEMSTGYPNNETGHPTRSYQLIHQNPFSLIGYKAYDWADPSYFLQTQAFLTGELAEALRRTGDQLSGIMHFAYMTWFRQCYDADRIAPYPTYYALRRALQPVLVSAELWGRHYYAGDRIPTRIYVVNDDDAGRDLPATELRWRLVDGNDRVLTSGRDSFPAVPYYGRTSIEPEILLPATLDGDRIRARLELELYDADRLLSRNRYELTLGRRSWNRMTPTREIRLLDGDGMSETLAGLRIPFRRVASIGELIEGDPRHTVCVISGTATCTAAETAAIRAFQQRGGRLLLLNAKELARSLYPEYITGWILPSEGDIVVMEREEDAAFDGLEPLDLRYFNDGRRAMPKACNATLKAVRHSNVTELASQMKIHGYIDGGTPEDRIAKVESLRGLTLLRIADGAGRTLISTLCTEKSMTDPVAGRLLVNLLTDLDGE